MLATSPGWGLTDQEVEMVRSLLGREPTDTEWAVVSAEWAEHSSYKSSKAILGRLPTKGKRVVIGPGYDAGAVDVGEGYVVTLHIESHNHPSAVDPYGGAATGIGGVLRDIISVGSRPIALVDVLRFGNPEQSAHSRWLFRNVVRGIADYGNCVGVPTVAGDIEFDEAFERACLVDVACIGIGRKDAVILGEAKRPGDIILLIGGSTGRDGVGGAAFASKNLSKGPDSERASVQVPDPFMKKLLLDAILEVCATGLVHGMKDLGGGGLSTALSEITSKGGTGADVDLAQVPTREQNMTPGEVVTSESQERMILILAPERSEEILRILERYEVPYAAIGQVTSTLFLTLRWNGRVVANLPAKAVAEAPLMPRRAKKPQSHCVAGKIPRKERDIKGSLLGLLSSPNISCRKWVYEQYDHEVGLRTILKPGGADASVIRLPHGPMLAVKADGNSRHSSLDPRRGGAGCVAEASRNVVAVGAEPIAAVDHLQFGDPSNEEVYWAFVETIDGMAEYCRALPLPIVGGKVSFYNADAVTNRAIKPSPVALVVGLMPTATPTAGAAFSLEGERVFLIGVTADELGGSEYYESILNVHAGVVPLPDARRDSAVYGAVRDLVRRGIARAVHDCSKGGLATALAEMCIPAFLGADIDVGRIPGDGLSAVESLFSESHGRFVVAVKNSAAAETLLSRAEVPFAQIGKARGSSLRIRLGTKIIAEIGVDSIADAWGNPIERLMG